MADRYWVGSSGNWSDTNKWSTASGGAGGASVPTSADNVIFDAASNTGTGAFTVTVDGTSSSPSVCADFSTGGAGGALDGAMTLTMGSTAFLDCYGSMTIPATNFAFSGTNGSAIRFKATSTGKTFTTNGVNINNIDVTFDGVGGGWTLGSALTGNTSSIITVTNGTFDTGNYNVTAGSFSSSNSNTRTITLGSSTLTFSANGAAWTTITTTNLTFNSNTSTITLSAASPDFYGGGLTFYNVTFSSTSSGTVTINSANTFNNLTQTSRAATGIRYVVLSANQTVSNTLTFGTANTAIRRMLVYSDTLGTQRTITLNGTLATLADVDFRDIVAAGTAGTWTGTRIGNGLNNSGITFDAPKSVYWNLAGTQNWSATGWATTNNGSPAVNNFPLAQDTATFTEAGAAGTVSIDNFWWIGSIQMADGISNRTTAFTLTCGNNPFIYGNVTLFSNLTTSGSGELNFSGQGVTQTITSAGITFTQSIVVDSPGGTFKIDDNFTSTATGGFTLTSGTVDLNTNKTLTCYRWSSSNSNTRSIEFGTSGQITLTGNNGTTWSSATLTNFSFTGTSNVVFNYSGSTGTRTISHGNTAGGTEARSISFSITAGTDTVTTTATANLKNFDFTGFSGTLSNTARNIYGNLTISSGMTLTAGTGLTTFAATSGTQQITTNGVTIDFPITQNSPGATLQLQDNLTLGSTRTFTLTAGTLNLSSGNRTLSTGAFSSSNSNTRSISFGTGQITLTGNATNIWSSTTLTNFSFTGTSNVVCNYSGSTGTRTINHGATAGGSETTALPFYITAGTDIVAISNSSKIKNLDFTGFSGTLGNDNYTIYGNLTISSGMTVTAGAGIQTFAATSGTQQITTNGKTLDLVIIQNNPGATLQIQDNLTLGTTRTYTLTAGTLDLSKTANLVLSTGIFDSSNSNTRAITFGTTGQITLTGNNLTIWNAPTLTNFSYTGTPSVVSNYSGSTGSRNIANGNSADATESNVVSFSITAGTDTVTSSGVLYVKNLNFTGFSGTLSNRTITVYGNAIFSSGMAFIAGTQTTTFAATSGTQQITTNGVTLDFPVTVNAPGATVQLQDALTIGSTRTLTLTAGTLDANNQNVTTGLFSSSNTNVRTITMGSGTWTITSAGNSWDTSTATNLTLNANTSTISMTSSSAKTFKNASGQTYYNLNQGGSGALTINDAATFNSIANSTQPATILFPATKTVTVSSLGLNGTAGNLVTLNSSSTGSKWYISDTTGTNAVTYASIRDSVASGGATFTCSNGVNAGDNYGWSFIDSTSTGNGFLAFF